MAEQRLKHFGWGREGEGMTPDEEAFALRNYRDLHEAYVKPAFGRTQLVNITPARLNAYYAELLASGRRASDGEVTVYKAMGIAMEDMVAANLAYQRAKREGGGSLMAW